MNGSARMSALVLSLISAAVLSGGAGCSPKGRNDTAVASSTKSGDSSACSEICDASAACGEALVACVDDAGRDAIRKDNSTLLVAARAICERGARCGGGSAKEANKCVDRIASTNPPPRGLGIFGAIKPNLVAEFAACMQSSECGAGGATCFGEMLGETGGSGDDGASETAPSPPPGPPAEGGSKI